MVLQSITLGGALSGSFRENRSAHLKHRRARPEPAWPIIAARTNGALTPDRCLGSCAQADLGQWLTGTSGHLVRLATFVRWAATRKQASALP